MDYFILEITWLSHITISIPYGSADLTSVIKQFNISHIFLLVLSRLYFHYIKDLFPNIYLLNNKQDLKAHLNKT